ncbi:response regulator [Methylobacillus gramineus]|uniref:response regulator n=1 Tax=Methylobacillus gramineus TaxID=755169 RepID=UPI001CFF5DA6|nr:response regulator [Methylobacillus gramineus]MCB5184580.1 response regulator [Methylobacillus gramineus]
MGLASHQSRHVLIVEDYQAAAETFQELLEMLGHRADYVMNGYEVEQALQANAYDVVFMDINLPDISGLELIAQLRAKLGETIHQLKFVAVTGYVQSELAGLQANTPFDFYLEKPVDLANLERILTAI